MTRKLGITLSGLILLVLSLSWGSSYAQAEDSRYYDETGHSVSGEFLHLYLTSLNPEFLYGYPITEVFTDSVTGQPVQYFQRARFEMDTAAPPGQRVRATNLGDLVYKRQLRQPLAVPANASPCRFFPQYGGHRVCFAFLEFFDKHGGVNQFGFPISDLELEDERMVQYFERARFVWNPRMPAGHMVQLSEVGWMYFYLRGEDRAYTDPVVLDDLPQSILSLRARAFTDRALVSASDPVMVYVIVQDQTYQPVEQAQVRITVRLPTGERETYLAEDTDAHGVSQFSFAVNSPDIGIVEVLVSAQFSDKEANTRTAFRIWW